MNYQLKEKLHRGVYISIILMFIIFSFTAMYMYFNIDNLKMQSLEEDDKKYLSEKKYEEVENSGEKDSNIRVQSSKCIEDEGYNGKFNSSNDKLNYNNDNNKVFAENLYKKDGHKTAYLTFDDGPSFKVTPQILDILKKNNIKATFFVIGQNALNNKKMLKREYMEGHSIGSHSYDHDYKNIYKSSDGFEQEVTKGVQCLKDILGPKFNTRLFRFPGGSFGNVKNDFKNILKNKGMVYIDWNALNGDAERQNINEDWLFDRIVSTVGEQDKVVILMHDTDAKQATAKCLPRIIKYLKSKGYEFKQIK